MTSPTSTTVSVAFTGSAAGLTAAAAQGESAMDKWRRGVSRATAAAAVAATAAAAAIGAALTTGVSAALEKSRANSILAASLGATGVEAHTLGQAAGRVYARGVIGSIEEATAAVRAVVADGLVGPDAGAAEIDRVAAKVANLGLQMQEESSRVSAAVSTMLKSGLAKNAEEAFDLLQRGFEQGLNKGNDLLDTFIEYPSVLKTMGLDAQTTMGLIQQGMSDAAFNSDKLVDAVKEFSVRAVTDAKPVSDAFKALGLNAKTMRADIAAGGDRAAGAFDKVLDKLRTMPATAERAMIIQDLFGGPGEDLGAALFALDVDKASKAMGNFAGATDQAGKTLEQSGAARVERFKRAFVDGMAQTVEAVVVGGERIVGFFRDQFSKHVSAEEARAGLDALRQTGQRLTGWFNDTLKPAVVEMYERYYPKLREAVDTVINAFRDNETEIKQVLSTLQTMGNWVVSNLIPALGSLAGFLAKGVASSIALFIGWVAEAQRRIQLIAGAAVAVKNAVGAAFNGIVSFAAALPGQISSRVSGAFNGIRTAFQSAINWVIDKWNGLSFRVPSIKVPGLGEIGGTTVRTPQLPRMAAGGRVRPGRSYLVGELGKEVFTPDSGGKLTPNSEIGGDTIIYVTIDGEQLQGRIDRTVKESRRKTRRDALAKGALAWQ